MHIDPYWPSLVLYFGDVILTICVKTKNNQYTKINHTFAYSRKDGRAERQDVKVRFY